MAQGLLNLVVLYFEEMELECFGAISGFQSMISNWALCAIRSEKIVSEVGYNLYKLQTTSACNKGYRIPPKKAFASQITDSGYCFQDRLLLYSTYIWKYIRPYCSIILV